MILVCGADAEVAEWVRSRMPWVSDFGHCVAIGVAKGNRLVAGVVFNNWRGRNIEAAIAADEPGWCRRGVLAGLFHYPFCQAKAHRITCIVPAWNDRSLKLCLGLGFTEEGRVRELFEDGSDGVVCGLLARDCRWLSDALPSNTALDAADMRKGNAELAANRTE